MQMVKLKCENCGTVFIANDTRHHIDYCPGCNKSWVDMEDQYTRWGGKLSLVERLESPWFDDEDDYHSALMGWLNDSDEEYELEMDYDQGILTIIKC